MYRIRPARPDTSVTITKVRKEAPPAREAEMLVIFPLYYRFCPLSPRISWNFPQTDCLLSVLFLDTCLALQKHPVFALILYKSWECAGNVLLEPRFIITVTVGSWV